MPSGVPAKRKPLAAASPVVMIGVNSTPAAVGTRYAGAAVVIRRRSSRLSRAMLRKDDCFRDCCETSDLWRGASLLMDVLLGRKSLAVRLDRTCGAEGRNRLLRLDWGKLRSG